MAQPPTSSASAPGRFDSALRELHPAYFAMVMATAAVSVAASLTGMPAVAKMLLAINIPAYVLLWLLFAARFLRHPKHALGDLSDHIRGPAYFTWIAATALLGSQLMSIVSREKAGVAMWALSVFLWMVLIYGVFTLIAVKRDKSDLKRGISSGWLLAVVATQSVSVLSALVCERSGSYQHLVAFLALTLWLFGGMLYVWLITLIFYRETFQKLDPSDITPPYWINMGAMAIATLAGVHLLSIADQAPLQPFVPFIRGMTLLFWATGTWWLPLLLLLEAWRYLVRRYPFSYNPLVWSAVFPIGVYTSCTARLAEVMGIAILRPIPRALVFFALALWIVAIIGWLRAVARLLRPSRTAASR
ncbi:MAG: tellurite resistance/C4-dicarboxylate transporter family protein [Nitrococcus sp.]|nr:tellurite resistance/C4-dicarboxylate transporter family protein [Nitrococcus sp.]